MPQHLVYVPNMQISRTPVTNLQYQQFIVATGYPAPGHWSTDSIPANLADHPVVYVDWHDAQAFCRWAEVALPTEAVWEKAARGNDGRQWPWGNNKPDATLANYCRDPKTGITTPVNTYSSACQPRRSTGYGWQCMGMGQHGVSALSLHIRGRKGESDKQGATGLTRRIVLQPSRALPALCHAEYEPPKPPS